MAGVGGVVLVVDFSFLYCSTHLPPRLLLLPLTFVADGTFMVERRHAAVIICSSDFNEIAVKLL